MLKPVDSKGIFTTNAGTPHTTDLVVVAAQYLGSKFHNSPPEVQGGDYE